MAHSNGSQGNFTVRFHFLIPETETSGRICTRWLDPAPPPSPQAPQFISHRDWTSRTVCSNIVRTQGAL
jgi:hypothetical protein